MNLLGNAVHTYRFDARSNAFTPIQSLGDLPGLVRPENLAFSPDGAFLVVTNSIDGALNLYRVDGETHTIDPTPAASIRCGDSVNPHGVSFSPSSRALLFSTVEDPGSLRFFHIVMDSDRVVQANPVQMLANPMSPLKPKGVAISPDGCFAAIAYGPNATPRPQRNKRGFLAIHRFDPETGCSPKPLWTRGRALGLHCAEDVNFFPDGSHVVITDQASDSATVVAFDRRTGAIGETTMAIRNPLARLSFPHGNAVSGDGRFLAVANYGDDTVTVYDVAASTDQAAARP